MTTFLAILGALIVLRLIGWAVAHYAGGFGSKHDEAEDMRQPWYGERFAKPGDL